MPEEVAPFLEGFSLHEALEQKKIFIIDLTFVENLAGSGDDSVNKYILNSNT